MWSIYNGHVFSQEELLLCYTGIFSHLIEQHRVTAWPGIPCVLRGAMASLQRCHLPAIAGLPIELGSCMAPLYCLAGQDLVQASDEQAKV